MLNKVGYKPLYIKSRSNAFFDVIYHQLCILLIAYGMLNSDGTGYLYASQKF